MEGFITSAYWDRNIMAIILLITFPNIFSWKKFLVCLFQFHFFMVQMIIISVGPGNGLVQQAITLNSTDQDMRCHVVSLGLNELKLSCQKQKSQEALQSRIAQKSPPVLSNFEKDLNFFLHTWSHHRVLPRWKPGAWFSRLYILTFH